MRTSNPTLTPSVFTGMQGVANKADAMTISGVINKAAILLLLVLLTAGYTWSIYYKTGDAAAVAPWMMVGVFGGLIVAIATVVKKTWAPVTAPIYALLEGLFIGGLSATIEASYPGLVMQATALTFGTLAFMLFIYKSGIIAVTQQFRIGLVAATGAIALLYIVSMALSFFGISVPFIYGSGVFGIGFSIVVVFIAALNLVLDFDFIEQGARYNLPKYMEWYAAFGLMVTLIWLYVEMLRLLAKIRDR
ncbi:MAG: Bax inhibitor-1/YccA family protein [Chlamydiales bacterium]|nr:Bax inhibitor-1/YccA family protein [Chlamydiales bacterium]